MVAEARESGFAAAAEIADLCVLAGAPEKANDYITAKKTPSVVRAELMKAKAEAQKATAVDTTVMPGVDAKDTKPKAGTAKPWKEILTGLGLAKKETK
jgi:hypothetical protein